LKGLSHVVFACRPCFAWAGEFFRPRRARQLPERNDYKNPNERQNQPVNFLKYFIVHTFLHSSNWNSRCHSLAANSALYTAYRKSLRIGFQISLWIKLHAVEHLPAVIVLDAIRYSDLLHCIGVDVPAHHLLRESLKIGGAGHHAPAAKLSKPPLRKFWLREVAIPFAEMHV